MTDLIDIHCHVLPRVDDGARNTEQSLEMLSLMRREGIRSAILTPHYHGGYMETGSEKLKDRFGKLCAAAGQDDRTKDMSLYLGCEIYYYPSVVDWLDEGYVLSMAGSRYVLLEFGFTSDVRTIKEGISNVVNSGYVPIIAHLERYKKLVGDIKSVDELISKGAYIQINSEALTDGFKVRSFAKKLLKERMVHFLATDAHDTKKRAPKLSKAVSYIEKHYGGSYCRELVIDNPERVINNEYISG